MPAKAGLILNHLQPIVLGLLILWFNPTFTGSLQDIKNYNNIISIMIIYSIFIIIYSLQFKNELQCTMKNNETKHLDWQWNDLPNKLIIYIIFILSFVLLFILGLPAFAGKGQIKELEK